MCGRYVREGNPNRYRELLDAVLLGQAQEKPRYNVAPTQAALVARENPKTGDRELVDLKWGLIPFWAKDPKIGNKLINARAEEAAGKPAFRDAMQRRRCLICADAWYEWKKTPTGKIPMMIYRPGVAGGRAPFVFAGLWSWWRDKSNPEAQGVETFAILTREAAPELAHIHDRMPLVLGPEGWDAWLDRDLTDGQAAAAVLEHAVLEGFAAVPVSTRVNSPANDDEGCIEPMTQPL